ncbi:hypothetical protein ACHHV8_29855 [Paenibacillus sp. TAB 01]|uniref:hypothetical protein n=1 Tax=Paenibacillus sp. TAB 01 TaxID=3368988 RepID=UPI0037533441
MNNIFLLVFFFIVVITLVSDMKKMQSQHKSLKTLYVVLYTLTSAMFICMLLGIKFLPTYLFVNNLSTWVHQFLQV